MSVKGSTMATFFLPLKRLQRQLPLQLPHLLDGDVALALALLQPVHVRVVAIVDAPAARALAAAVRGAFGALNRRRQGGGHGPLSGAFRADEEVGVVEPVAGHGAPQQLDLPAVARDVLEPQHHFTSRLSPSA